jgi:reversion-inducing cysteine-rich kazal motif protein
VLDALEEGCGPVAPHSGLWGCLLKSAPAKPQRLPLNVGKLACCSRASRRTCQNLCWRAFQTDWSAWQQLEATCLASSTESELRRCLDDTDDACEMGCSGLSFCSRFNDRPTTLFR